MIQLLMVGSMYYIIYSMMRYFHSFEGCTIFLFRPKESTIAFCDTVICFR